MEQTSKTPLDSDTITFGKYKNGTLQQILKDRSYCTWLLQQDWFKTSYEYLHNRVLEFEPCSYFFKKPSADGSFLDRYQFFHLVPVDEIKLPLTDSERKCYTYYLQTIDDLKKRIEDRSKDENQYDIKAPTNWLKRFEKESGLNRVVFKEFMSSYELPNITYVVERIKKEGGIEYKGAKSFIIAKQRSEEQEAYWEKILKEKYGEDLGAQFKYEKCIFDFVHISKNIVFECKLGLKDFNLEQYNKYKLALNKYKIVYLIGRDAVIHMEEKAIFTTDVDKYSVYQEEILCSKHTSKFDEEIRDYTIVDVDDLSTVL